MFLYDILDLWFFLKFYISGIILHVLFLCLASFAQHEVSEIHPCCCISNLLLLVARVEFYCMNDYSLFMYVSIDRHLSISSS